MSDNKAIDIIMEGSGVGIVSIVGMINWKYLVKHQHMNYGMICSEKAHATTPTQGAFMGTSLLKMID